MLSSLPDFLSVYWMYIGGLVLVCAIACYLSKKLCATVKKILIVCVVAFCLATGYELVTGKSIFRLPGDVDRKLSEDPTEVESGRRYYKSYEERYGQEVPRE